MKSFEYGSQGNVAGGKEKKLAGKEVTVALAALVAMGGLYKAVEYVSTDAPTAEQNQAEKVPEGGIKTTVINGEEVSFNFDGKPKTLEDLKDSAPEIESKSLSEQIGLVYQNEALSKKEKLTSILALLEKNKGNFTFSVRKRDEKGRIVESGETTVSPAYLLMIELAQNILDQVNVEEQLSALEDPTGSNLNKKIDLEAKLAFVQDRRDYINERQSILLDSENDLPYAGTESDLAPQNPSLPSQVEVRTMSEIPVRRMFPEVVIDPNAGDIAIGTESAEEEMERVIRDESLDDYGGTGSAHSSTK